MTARLRRALDHRPVKPSRTVLPLQVTPHRQVLSIRAALEWAFGTECASLDFAESQGDNARPGVSPLWTVIQRGQLGSAALYVVGSVVLSLLAVMVGYQVGR